MPISTDITRLREAGKSDDEILSGLEKFAPQHSADIGKLREAGRSPADILTGFQRYEAQNLDPRASRPTSRAAAPQVAQTMKSLPPSKATPPSTAFTSSED